MTERPKSPLMHPLPMAAALLLALNDHVLKGAGILPGWLTGKLSDVAGMFVVPILVATIARRLSRKHALVDTLACVVVAGAFAAVKVLPPANALYEAVLGPTLIDASDLVALLVVPGAWMWLRRVHPPARTARAMSPWLVRVGVLAAALASMATSAIHPPAVPGPPALPRDTSEDCAEVMVLGVEPRGPDVALLVHLDNRTPQVCVIAFGRVELQGQSSGGMAGGGVAPTREERVDAQTARDVTFLLSPPYPVGCPPTAKLVLETSQRSVPPTSPWMGHATKTPPNGIELKCLPPSTIPVVVP